MFSEFPYSEWHQLNLDWILESIKYLMDHGGAGGAVISVNGKTGVVQLFPYDVGAIPMPENASAGQFLAFDGADWIADNIPEEIVYFNKLTTTGADIEAAYQAGKFCVVTWGNGFYFQTHRFTANWYKFARVLHYGVDFLEVHDSTWTNTSISYLQTPANPSANDYIKFDGNNWIAEQLPLYNGG